MLVLGLGFVRAVAVITDNERHLNTLRPNGHVPAPEVGFSGRVRVRVRVRIRVRVKVRVRVRSSQG